MTVLIFGVTGQDGYYLRSLLENLGLEVAGAARSSGEFRLDVSDAVAVREIVCDLRPSAIFHLAAISSTSHESLWDNHAAIGTGTLAILDAVDRELPSTKVLLAGSALQFVNNGEPLNEHSPLDHSSPYVVARNHSLFAARYYRTRGVKAYFAYLFNHDSPRRSSQHLNMKIAESAVRAAQGLGNRLQIGDLDAQKEFNYAGDVALALWQLVQQDDVYECVVGSGVVHTVRDWVDCCFKYVGLDWRQHVDSDVSYRSPYKRLISDPKRLHALGWRPTLDMSALVQGMMEAAIQRVSGTHGAGGSNPAVNDGK